MRAKKNEAAGTGVTDAQQALIQAGVDSIASALEQFREDHPQSRETLDWALIKIDRLGQGTWKVGFVAGANYHEKGMGETLGEALADLLQSIGPAGKLARAKRLRAEADQLEKEAEEGRESCKR